ncbi:ubiquitin-activating enzyme E1 1-like protein, partial [Trifolium pratense]
MFRSFTEPEESAVNSDRSLSGSNNNNSNSEKEVDQGTYVMPVGDNNPQEIDEDLHSRQLAVYGRETMRRLFGADVLVSGMQGLGVEIVFDLEFLLIACHIVIVVSSVDFRLVSCCLDIAKNLILAGVKSVTLHDVGNVELWDMSSNFVFSENDVGKNRALASVAKLQELNNAVVVQSLTSELTKE